LENILLVWFAKAGECKQLITFQQDEEQATLLDLTSDDSQSSLFKQPSFEVGNSWLPTKVPDTAPLFELQSNQQGVRLCLQPFLGCSIQAQHHRQHHRGSEIMMST